MSEEIKSAQKCSSTGRTCPGIAAVTSIISFFNTILPGYNSLCGIRSPPRAIYKSRAQETRLSQQNWLTSAKVQPSSWPNLIFPSHTLSPSGNHHPPGSRVVFLRRKESNLNSSPCKTFRLEKLGEGAGVIKEQAKIRRQPSEDLDIAYN